MHHNELYIPRIIEVRTIFSTDKRAQICSRQKKTLSCTPGSSIAVTGVFWGRTSPDICPSEDGDPVTNCFSAPETEEIVKKMCEGMGSCLLEGKASMLQKDKHCYGVNKYLLVNYTCVPQANRIVLCKSEKSLLTCPSDWVIRVNSAFWGRENPDICPSVNGHNNCPGASETISKLRTNCNNNPGCVVRALSDELQNGGENCPHVSKYLIVNYACRPSSGLARRGTLGRIPLSLYRRLGYRSKIPRPNNKSNV